MNVVKDAEEINDYDYNKMMSDFETTTRHEEHYQEKNKELERKLKQKNQTMLTALNSSNQAKMAEKKKTSNYSAKRKNRRKRTWKRN